MDDNKINNILKSIFQNNIQTFKDEEAKARIASFIKTLKEENEDYEKLNVSLFVQDVHKKQWRNRELFFKVFYSEIDYAMDKYNIKQAEVDFLLRLGRYCMWETNLLIDANGIPLNQKELAKELKVNIKTVQRNVNALYDKKALLKINYETANFYMINPYLLFVGKNINVQVPEVFNLFGYTPRSNRSEIAKKVTKVNKIQ